MGDDLFTLEMGTGYQEEKQTNKTTTNSYFFPFYLQKQYVSLDPQSLIY